ncbi:eukaryotic integral membrane protein-domain-containing protein [Halteromyces radiatus]|uniref:eukaryotic integral membrane protein-domain-containing protein n=1 Tax=Halteromyces radiatus TaxID=101107 RepID=UPI00221F7F13|nr:eukaryotic integral membrane protein-domain-containing protein [Halteromyces radiatus]KAI8099748.1 eukaryotic integral membrane protein-domain-containing protein [Halteromyces radiatus]
MMAPQFKTVVTNVPALTKALLTSVLMITGMASIYIYRQQLNSDTPLVYFHCPLLGLVPGLVLYAPWTLATSLFYENTLLSFILAMVVLLLCGKYLERVWGSRELFKFIMITGLVSNIVTWFAMVMTFYMTGDDNYLYNVQINGLAGVFSAFLVAFKFLIPEHRLSLFGGLVAIRVKNLIGVATLVSIICLVLFKALVFYNLVNIGWVVGWIYIRFFRVQDGVRGDRSDAFALVTFFPPFLSPVIGFLSNVTYQFFVKMNLCPPMSRGSTMYDMENQRHPTTPLPGSARAEAERRRALALKALDMRLSKPSSSSQVLSSSSTSTSAAIPTIATTNNNTSVPVSTSSNINTSTVQEQQQLVKNDSVLFDATTEMNKEG